jgi:hypothetical protein
MEFILLIKTLRRLRARSSSPPAATRAPLHSLPLSNRRKASITVLFPKGKVAPTQARQMTAVSARRMPPCLLSPIRRPTSSTSCSRGSLPTSRLPSASRSARSTASMSCAFSVRRFTSSGHISQLCRMRGLAIGERVAYGAAVGRARQRRQRALRTAHGLADRYRRLQHTRPTTSRRTFVRTGEFRVRAAVTTIAPAIDIGDPYNIQRVFYYLCGGKTDTVRQWMLQWTAGHFQLDAAHLDAFRRLFHVTEASEAEMADAIRTTYEQHNYLLDPHTAVAWVGAHKLVSRRHRRAPSRLRRGDGVAAQISVHRARVHSGRSHRARQQAGRTRSPPTTALQPTRPAPTSASSP